MKDLNCTSKTSSAPGTLRMPMHDDGLYRGGDNICLTSKSTRNEEKQTFSRTKGEQKSRKMHFAAIICVLFMLMKMLMSMKMKMTIILKIGAEIERERER